MSLLSKLNQFKKMIDLSPTEEARLAARFKEGELGFSHPQTGAAFRLKDNGAIQMTAGSRRNVGKSSLTFRLNPEAQSANLYAPKTNVIGERVNFQVEPDGFWINYRPLNPDLLDTPLVTMSPSALAFLNELMSTGYMVTPALHKPGTFGKINTIDPFLPSRYISESQRAAQELRSLISTELGGDITI